MEFLFVQAILLLLYCWLCRILLWFVIPAFMVFLFFCRLILFPFPSCWLGLLNFFPRNLFLLLSYSLLFFPPIFPFSSSILSQRTICHVWGVRSQVLGRDELLSLNETISTIRAEEGMRGVMIESQAADGSAMVSNGNLTMLPNGGPNQVFSYENGKADFSKVDNKENRWCNYCKTRPWKGLSLEITWKTT